MTRAMISRQEFIQQYTGGDEKTLWSLLDRGRHAIPCDCGVSDCKGWQMGHADEVDRYLARTLKRHDPTNTNPAALRA